MSLELTKKQRQALREQANGPIHLVDPDTRRSYVLVPREEYERLQALTGKGPSPAPVVSNVSPGILASQKAYWRDLPEMLKMKFSDRMWVAYHRDERIGFAPTDLELYQEIARRGIPSSEYYVDRVEPSKLAPWEIEEIEM